MQDDEGNPLETEFGLSTYRDHQTFSIQVHQSFAVFNYSVNYEKWCQCSGLCHCIGDK